MKEVRIAESKTKPKSATACWWKKLQGWRTCGCPPASAKAKVRGRREALALCRWRRDARFDVPSLRRAVSAAVVPVSRVEEDAFFRVTWQRASDAKNLKVIKVDTDENLLLVRGSVPGRAACTSHPQSQKGQESRESSLGSY